MSMFFFSTWGQQCPHFHTMKHVLFKVTDIQGWRTHCAFLNEYATEARETMKFESCVYERSIVYERDGEWYMVGSAIYNGEQKSADMNLEINIKHHEARNKYLGKVVAVFKGEFILPSQYEVLYEFTL